MRLTRLILRNWGPHESLDVDMDTPVFAILGPNASGKTNFLEAIEFLFNGTTARNQATYVRQVEGQEINNATVEGYFIKGGVKGRLWRQVGKSPGRKLWWENDGKPITKASEIDRIMSEILDCDKKAISQAVFLSQGHLADFLMSLPAQREQDFARMCMVDHLALVADIASQESIRLQKTVTDLTSQRDEAQLAREQAEAALRTAEGEVEILPDRGREIEWMSGWMTILRQWDQDQANAQVRLSNLLSAEERLKGVEKPQGAEADLGAQIDRLQQQLNAGCQAEAESRRLTASLAELKRDSARLTTVRAQLMATIAKSPRLMTVQTRRTELVDSLATMDSYSRSKEEHERYNLRLLEANAAESRSRTALSLLPETQVLEAEIDRLQKKLDDQVPRRLKIQLAREAAGHVKGCCPLCEGTDLSRLPTGEELDRAERALIDEKNETATALRNANQAVSERQKLEGTVKAQSDVMETILAARPPAWEGKMLDLEERPALATELATLEVEYQDLQTEMRVVPHLNTDIADLTSRISLSPGEDKLLADIKTADSQASEVSSLRTTIRLLTDYRSTISGHQKSVDEARATFEQSRLTSGQSEKAVDETWARRPKTLNIERDALTHTLSAALAELKEQQATLDRAKGAVVAHVDTMRRAENRVSEIEERARRNAATLTVIGHLEDLRQAFGRQGISRHYLSKVFDSLVSMVQDRLSEWDVDFQVEKDEANLFNFLFYRTHSPDTLLDQSQLSGGQRTRLALSFVQAVQHLLYPGLDFLCVDEPSNHLDTEGVEGLVRLFQTMATQNESGEAQVLVVDHNPLLKQAFKKSITLGNK